MSVIVKFKKKKKEKKKKNPSPGASQFIRWTILFKFQEIYFDPLLRRHVRLYKSTTYNNRV